MDLEQIEMYAQMMVLEKDYHISELDYLRIGYYKEVLSALCVADNRFYYLYDHYKDRYCFLNRNSIFFTFPENYEEINNVVYLSHIHPDDVLFFLALNKAAHSYSTTIAPQEVMQCTVHYNVRLRLKEGQYVMAMHRVKPMQIDPCGNLWLTLGIFELDTESSYIDPYIFNPTTGLKLPIFSANDDRLDFAPKIGSFTPRETRLLNAFKNGKTSLPELAEELNLAVQSVKYHIMNIRKKTNCERIDDALKIAYLIRLFDSN